MPIADLLTKEPITIASSDLPIDFNGRLRNLKSPKLILKARDVPKDQDVTTPGVWTAEVVDDRDQLVAIGTNYIDGRGWFIHKINPDQ